MMTSIADSNERTISVAMTTYNGATYLEAQLDSILAQTLLPFELVVGDDASIDNTVQILEEFAKRAPFPVTILRNNPGKGVIENFCYVFTHCKGKYIAYCDQDDVWERTKLRLCYDALRRNHAASVSHMSLIVDSELRSTGQLMPTGFAPGVYPFPSYPQRYWRVGHQLIFSSELVGPLNILRRSPRKNLQPCAANLDMLITVVAGMWGTTVFLPDPLVKFRRHESTVSGCGKEDPDSGGMDKFREKRRALSGLLSVARELCLYLAEDDKEDRLGLGAVRKAQYVEYLERLTRALSARIMVYKGKTFTQRAMGLVNAFQQGAYWRQKRGGGGIKQAIVDAVVLASSLRN